MISKAVQHVAATIGVLVLLYLLVYMGVATKDLLSPGIFIVVIGSIGVWFFRSARAKRAG